jgi:hypothetical protein
MVSKISVAVQLKRAGKKFRFFGRAEANELKNVLRLGESIIQCAYGHYHGGSGLIVATDQRIILLDKRPFYLNVESMEYENIRHIDFKTNKFHGILYVQNSIKRVIFRSISDARLKKIKNHATLIIEEIKKPIFSEPSRASKSLHYKSYLNPSWRPHHLTLRALGKSSLPKNYRKPSRQLPV